MNFVFNIKNKILFTTSNSLLLIKNHLGNVEIPFLEKAINSSREINYGDTLFDDYDEDSNIMRRIFSDLMKDSYFLSNPFFAIIDYILYRFK